MSYAKIRQSIYNEIEREIQMRKLFMCPNCKFYINEKCTKEICVNKVRRSVCNENSKSKNIRVKRGGI